MALSSYSKEDKQTHVELWSESGLSKQEYSIEIKYKTFLNWVYRFGTKPSQNHSSTIEILHPNGIQLSCPVNIDVDQLKTILILS